MMQLHGWFASRVEHLRSVLQVGSTSSIHEFLIMREGVAKYISHLQAKGFLLPTCKNTFPNILSVSSLNFVLNITVTRSKLDLM